jgi:hypothetical protein
MPRPSPPANQGFALYPVSQLCLHIPMAVVQNGAMVANIEMGILDN